MLGTAIAALVLSGITVLPSAGCPTVAKVAAELDRLGATAALEQVGNAEVVIDRGELRIIIRERTGSALGSRAVFAPKDCQARAALAAVLIAAWTGEWMKTLPSNPSGTAPVLIPSATSVSAAPAEDPHVEVGAFAFGIHDGDAGGWGGGARADIRWRVLGAFVLAEASADRERPIGPVMARYGLVRGGAGMSARYGWSRAFADVAVAPEIVRYAISGTSMARPNDVVSWQAWADVRLRVGLSLGVLSPFVYAGASWSFVRQNLKLDDQGARPITLSRANVAVGLGISVTLR